MNRCTLGIVGLFGAVLLTGCAQQAGPVVSKGKDLSGRKVRVVTTTGMITDLVRNVGGDRVEVTGLMGPGVDPHLYKATEGDRERMAQADVVFFNGFHLEGKMADLFTQRDFPTQAATVTRSLDYEKELRPAPEGFEGLYDPHVWFDVRLWSKAADVVREILADHDPAHEAQYKANAERYQKELAELHEYVKTQAAKVPPGQRILITAHDAFYYFGQAYGFKVEGLQGISTADEAKTSDVQRLANLIVDNKVPAIFVESSVPTKNLLAVQRAVQARGFNVALSAEGQHLYSDALGDPGTPAGTYTGMIRHNIDTIVKALGKK